METQQRPINQPFKKVHARESGRWGATTVGDRKSHGHVEADVGKICGVKREGRAEFW